MKPLPATRYEYAEWKTPRSTSTITSMSPATTTACPTAWSGSAVEVRLTATTRRVLLQGQARGGPCALQPARPPHHAARAHARGAPQAPAVDAGAAAQLGLRASVRPRATWCSWQLENRPHPEQGYRACLGLLNLAKQLRRDPPGGRLPPGADHRLTDPQDASSSILDAKLDQHPELFPAADQTPRFRHPGPARQRARGGLLPSTPQPKEIDSMLIQPTLDTLNRLKLYGMAAALSEQLTQSAASGLAFDERLGLLRRPRGRLSRQSATHALAATRPAQATRLRRGHRLSRPPRPRSQPTGQPRQLRLDSRGAESDHHGATGCGKTFLACALAHQACRQGLSALVPARAAAVRGTQPLPRRRQLPQSASPPSPRSTSS